jgi:hypothetical protein
MSLLQLARGKDERNTVPTTHPGELNLELLCYRMFFSGHSSAAYAKATHTRLRCSRIEVIATKFYGRYHDLVDRCEISISQMIIDRLIFTKMNIC